MEIFFRHSNLNSQFAFTHLGLLIQQRRKVYRESVQQLRQAQLKQQHQTYRKGGGGGPPPGGAGGTGTRFQQPTIPPPHHPQQQQQHQQGAQETRTKSRSKGHLPDEGTGGQQHRPQHHHLYTAAQLQQAQQLQVAQQLTGKHQQYHQQQQPPYHQHHHQGTMTGPPVVQPQPQPYQSIMKKPTSGAPTSQYGQQTIREMISPPEGFGDESMTPYVMEQESAELKNSEEKQFYADIQRRLQAKAQMYQTMDSYTSAKSRSKSSSYLVPSNQDSYVTGHQVSSISKDQKSLSKSQKSIRMSYPATEPVSANDDSYELCVASDAELHTLGLQHQSSQHYFSLPKHSHHRHHRPVSTSPPAGTATLMRPPHLIYRRTDSDGFNNTA